MALKAASSATPIPATARALSVENAGFCVLAGAVEAFLDSNTFVSSPMDVPKLSHWVMAAIYLTKGKERGSDPHEIGLGAERDGFFWSRVDRIWMGNNDHDERCRRIG